MACNSSGWYPFWTLVSVTVEPSENVTGRSPAVPTYTALSIGDGNFGKLDGFISEIIVYASDQSANRTGIEGNINSAYSIY